MFVHRSESEVKSQIVLVWFYRKREKVSYNDQLVKVSNFNTEILDRNGEDRRVGELCAQLINELSDNV